MTEDDIPQETLRQIQDVVRAQLDRQVAQALDPFAGATTANTGPTGTLTLDKLHQMLDRLPKQETWVCSGILTSPKSVLIADTPDEKFYVVHPIDVAAIERAYGPMAPGGPGHPNPLFGLTITEIDPYHGDSEAAAEWRGKLRKRVLDAIAGTMAGHIHLREILQAGRAKP